MDAPVKDSFVKRIARLPRLGMRQLVQVVFPPICAGCGKLSTDHQSLCVTCWQGVSFIEKPYCEKLGIPFAVDHGEGALSALAIAEPPPFDQHRSAVIYQGGAQRLSRQLKYHDRTDLAPMMAKWMQRAGGAMIDSCDLIIPIPLHRWQLLSRRFNQAAELARNLSVVAKLPLLAGALQRKKATKQQVGLNARMRRENLRSAFAVRPEFIEQIAGKRILLIDDVYTTGATVSAAARCLKRAGAEQVFVLTFAMAITQPI